MLFTYEEVKERNRYPRIGDLSLVVINKKNELVFYGKTDDVIEWVKTNCYKKVEWNSYYTPIWGSRISEWIEKSIDKEQRYKGYKFYYYDKHWERKIKITKILNNNVVKNI